MANNTARYTEAEKLAILDVIDAQIPKRLKGWNLQCWEEERAEIVALLEFNPALALLWGNYVAEYFRIVHAAGDDEAPYALAWDATQPAEPPYWLQTCYYAAREAWRVLGGSQYRLIPDICGLLSDPDCD